MTGIEVRGISDDELAAYLRCMGVAFHFSAEAADEHVAFAREFYDDLSRRLAAFVDGSLCGTAASFPVELTVPGGATVPTCAVTQVTVLPTHRRRGLLGSMMRAQLHDAMDRGEIAAMLIAAEWPIYGRFGYGMATEAVSTVLDASSATFIDARIEGSVELVDAATLTALAQKPFDRHRLTSPGSINRAAPWWPLYSAERTRPGMEPPKSRVRVVHRGADGEVDGYAMYDPGEVWEHNRPKVSLGVSELLAATPAAWRDLWRFLANVDWVTEVRASVRAVDEDLRPLLVDGRAARQADRSDHMWVRLFDIAAALEARSYEAPVHTLIAVDDPYLDRGGVFLLDASPDGTRCTNSDREPDVSLGIDVLSGAYLGGSSLAAYQMAGRVAEHTEGAVASLDRALRTSRAPWATTGF